MTNLSSALRPVSGLELEALRPLLAAVGGPALRLAVPVPAAAVTNTSCPHRLPAALRNVDLVADLRRARAARFANRYEWLALRRRRAQIAARWALER
jgi:hypothetical protein